jgi:hypothetical protein
VLVSVKHLQDMIRSTLDSFWRLDQVGILCDSSTDSSLVRLELCYKECVDVERPFESSICCNSCGIDYTLSPSDAGFEEGLATWAMVLCCTFSSTESSVACFCLFMKRISCFSPTVMSTGSVLLAQESALRLRYFE